ncbi:MAG: hypothetical protein ACXAD7_07990 [Candidatus Kariarchaeaceae archaeon]
MANSDDILELVELIFDENVSWGEKYHAIQSIELPEYIAKVALSAKEPDIRFVATRKLHDQKVLAKVVLQDPDHNVRKQALSNLKNWNRDIFREVVVKDDHWSVRRAALERLPPIYQDLFVQITIQDTHWKVRKIAMEKLRIHELNEEQLVSLAIHAFEPMIRKAALREISNEDALFKIALEANDYTIGEISLESIQNQEHLKVICRNAEFAHIRMKAARLIIDEHFLARIIQEDANLSVRRACFEQINTIEILVGLRLSGDQDLQSEVVKRMEHIENSK